MPCTICKREEADTNATRKCDCNGKKCLGTIRFLMALGTTQPLREMNTSGISWGKGGWCVRVTSLPSLCVECLKILGASTSWIPMSLPRLVLG
jgi:hypothetical protein